MPMIAPNGSITTELSVFTLFRVMGIKDTGTYRLSWMLSEKQGNEQIGIKSNEISILWKEGTSIQN